MAASAEGTARWRAAAAVVALVGTTVLAAGTLRPIIDQAVFALRAPDSPFAVAGSVWLRAVVWMAVGAAVTSRRRILAVPVVWAAVVFEFIVARGADTDLDDSAPAGAQWWPLMAAAVALLLSVSGPLAAAAHRLGPAGRRLLSAVAAVTAASSALFPLFTEYFAAPDPTSVEYLVDPGFYPTAAISTDAIRTIYGVTYVALAALIVMILVAVDPAVRSRAAALLAACTAAFAVLQLGDLPLFMMLVAPVLTYPDRLVALAAASGLVCGLLLWRVRRADRTRPDVSGATDAP
ncbi:hypothetical protein [Actinoplanes sp. NPDC049118]|uniref:hypothetical protein n=1 Tax=Actinoplanes sp. NPDC049118 TaxID=3155769 RepID=UPI0033C16923